MDTIVNKVAESGLITIDLEAYYPKNEFAVFDLKDHLFMGLVLKEKDFRAALQTYNWEQFSNKNVVITCSADAIIPMWANMLVASYLQPVAHAIGFGTQQTLTETLFLQNLQQINPETFTDKRVLVKGCGDLPIPEAAYVELTTKLRPYVKSLMYGEACSNVPIYKKK